MITLSMCICFLHTVEFSNIADSHYMLPSDWIKFYQSINRLIFFSSIFSHLYLFSFYQCSLACHKKCLETLAIQCGHKKLQGRLHLFGIDFAQASKNSPDGIPFIIKKCTSEIESRALNIKVNLVFHTVELLIFIIWYLELHCLFKRYTFYFLNFNIVWVMFWK